MNFFQQSFKTTALDDSDATFFDPERETLESFLFGDPEDTQPIPVGELFQEDPVHFAYMPDEITGNKMFAWMDEVEEAEAEYGLEEIIYKENVPCQDNYASKYSSRPNTPEFPLEDELPEDDAYGDFIGQYVKDAEFYSYATGRTIKIQENEDDVHSLYEGSVIVDRSSQNYYSLKSEDKREFSCQWDFGDFEEARERILNADITVQSKILLLDALEDSL